MRILLYFQDRAYGSIVDCKIGFDEDPEFDSRAELHPKIDENDRDEKMVAVYDCVLGCGVTKKLMTDHSLGLFSPCYVLDVEPEVARDLRHFLDGECGAPFNDFEMYAKMLPIVNRIGISGSGWRASTLVAAALESAGLIGETSLYDMTPMLLRDTLLAEHPAIQRVR